MMDKGPKKQYVEIQHIPFQNDDPINDHLDNTGKSFFEFQPTVPLHSVV